MPGGRPRPLLHGSPCLTGVGSPRGGKAWQDVGEGAGGAGSSATSQRRQGGAGDTESSQSPPPGLPQSQRSHLSRSFSAPCAPCRGDRHGAAAGSAEDKLAVTAVGLRPEHRAPRPLACIPPGNEVLRSRGPGRGAPGKPAFRARTPHAWVTGGSVTGHPEGAPAATAESVSARPGWVPRQVSRQPPRRAGLTGHRACWGAVPPAGRRRPGPGSGSRLQSSCPVGGEGEGRARRPKATLLPDRMSQRGLARPSRPKPQRRDKRCENGLRDTGHQAMKGRDPGETENKPGEPHGGLGRCVGRGSGKGTPDRPGQSRFERRD